MDSCLFLTLVSTVEECRAACLLIDSLRSFGGAPGQGPILVFAADPEVVPCDSLLSPGVRIVPLAMPKSLQDYPLADKTCACAQAEALAGPGTRSLVWLDAKCLFLKPPELLDLSPTFDIALRPVHIRNIGLPKEAPLDDFWRRIYTAAGLTDTSLTVESFVDCRRIRAYFNTHITAVNPQLGLFRRWQETLTALVEDRDFQSGPCRDDLHRIFLHQAVLSALIAATVEPARIRILPPDYSYPYNLQARVPPERRARTLNELTCAVYEGRDLDPARVTDIEIREPLRSWLEARRG